MSSSRSKEDEDDQLSKYEGVCAGLTPILEAVDELPSGGSPIIPVVQTSVRQFFVQQISTANPTAASSSSISTGSKPPWVRPKDVQDTKQLHDCLQKHIKEGWVEVGCKRFIPLVSAATQLVADAVHQVARQQLVEKNSQAYSILLDEGYRAGVMAQGCAALKAAIGLRVITHPQLVHVLFVARQATAEGVSGAFKQCTGSGGLLKIDLAATRSYAWSQLKPYYVGSSSSSSPPWQLGDGDLWDVLAKFVEVTGSCLPDADSGSGVMIAGMQIRSELLDSGAFAAFTAVMHDALAGKGDGCPAGVVVVPADGARSTSSGSSGSGVQAAAGKAAAGASRKQAASENDSGTTVVSSSSRASSTKTVPDGSSNNNSSSRRDADCNPVDVQVPATEHRLSSVITDLPLDDCPLLASFCSGMGPVVAAVANWQTAPPQPGRQQALFFAPLRAAIKHYASLQLAVSGSSSSGSSSSSSSSGAQQVAGASKRRTIVPLYYPDNVFAELSFIPRRLAMLLHMLFGDIPVLQQHMEALPDIVQGVVKQVAQEQAVEKDSPAFKLLAQSAAVAGLAAMACAVVQAQVGITLRTEEQFLSALKQTCDACTKAFTAEADAGVKHSIAFNLYQTLTRLTAPVDSTGSDSSGTGSSGSSGSGKGPGFAIAKCDLDVVYTVLDNFQNALVLMMKCEGPMTRARALKLAPWDAAFSLASKPIEAISGPLSYVFECVKAAEVAGDGKEAATGDQAADWGKGKGLAGLKGLFAGNQQSESVPAAKPVATRANGSGAAVANSSTSKAAKPAATVKGTAAQAAAAAADGTQQAAATAAAAGSSSSSEEDVEHPDLLAEANLKRFYCSPDTFAFNAVEPLPEDSLKLLVKLELHTTYRFNGWNALHYACASHRIELVKQLLDAGASVSEPEYSHGMQPLHLACLGWLADADAFYELIDCGTLSDFITFVKQCGHADGRLAALLLERGANASAKSCSKWPELTGVTPLHILSLWTAEHTRGRDLVFCNPFVGKACRICNDSPTPSFPVRVKFACADLEQASAGRLGLRSTGAVTALLTYHDPSGELAANCQATLQWDLELQYAFLHVRAAQVLLSFGADPDVQGGLQQNTPLMLAAGQGNAAMTALLLAAGADPERIRADGARALEIAAYMGYPRVAWALLCYGAQALPTWHVSGKPAPVQGSAAALPFNMLVFQAIQCDDPPWNIRFLERLLADGVGLEDVCPKNGQTPLLMAISYRDAEMVRLLVMAGADVNACLTTGTNNPAIAWLLSCCKEEKYEEERRDILQTLMDAGADLHSWSSEGTDYDLLQFASNMGLMDPALKLVEAGCKWQTPKGQRVVGGTVYYPPEILCIQVPTLANKIAYVESRFKRAEKMGRQKRAVIATALQPWLRPNVTPECKEATIRCLIAAGVTPGQAARSPVPRPPVPLPRNKAPWATAQAAVDASREAGSHAVPTVQAGQQQNSQGMGNGSVVDDLDAMLAEIESVGRKDAAAAGATTKGASKKKKKETAAQKEAKKKQQLRAQLLQQQRQAGSGSESEDDVSSSRGDQSRPAAATASTEAAAHAATAAETNSKGSSKAADKARSNGDGAVAQQALPAAKQLQQGQVQMQGADKTEQKSKQGEANQQQQAQAGKSHTAAGAAADGGTPSPAVRAAEQRPATPRSAAAAAAAPQPPPQAMQAALHAATSQRTAAAAAAAACVPAPGAMKAPQQLADPPQGATIASHAALAAQPAAAGQLPAGNRDPVILVQQTPSGLPGAVPAAHVSVAAAAGARPTAAPMRPAFLPPHLRMSRPAPAAAAQAAPPATLADNGVGAGMQPSPALQFAAAAGQGLQAVQAQGMHAELQGSHAQGQLQPPLAVQQVQDSQQGAGLRQRMVEMAQQNQLQQQALQQGAPALQQQQMSQPQPQQLPVQQQQHQHEAPPLPALPDAMMALLSSSSVQHKAAAAGAAGHPGHKVHAAGAAGAAHKARPASHRQQQQQQQHVQAQSRQRAGPAGPGGLPVPAIQAAAAAATVDGVAKGPKPCIACSQRRRNVLLIPCNHMLLCEVCADQLHDQGKLGCCPHCRKPCKQRIRVHQS